MALAFDVENDWNYKNRNQIAQGRWQASSSSSSRGGSNNSSSDASFTKVRSGSCDYGWLCDLINRYGEGERRFFYLPTLSIDKILSMRGHGSQLQCVIINKSDDKKTVRSRLEDSAVAY